MKKTKGNSGEKYIPISCNYYDYLESIATLKKVVQIVYLNPRGTEEIVEGRILDFRIKDKVEYLVLTDQQTIRLDKLIRVDGVLLSDNKFC
jgi:Rho-binding antiterminator